MRKTYAYVIKRDNGTYFEFNSTGSYWTKMPSYLFVKKNIAEIHAKLLNQSGVVCKTQKICITEVEND